MKILIALVQVKISRLLGKIDIKHYKADYH